MIKVPEIKQFLHENIDRVAFPFIDEYIEDNNSKARTIIECMIEFAELHVKAALEAAYNNREIVRSKVPLDQYDYAESQHFDVDKDSIIYAYPLTNIQ